MGYTTTASIKRMFRSIKIEAETGTASQDTAITNEDVAEFIIDADAEIDAKLTEFYMTPITGTEALKYVALISKYKVAHVIKTVLEAQSQTSDREQDVQGNLGRKADELLNALLPKIINGKILDSQVNLSDAPRKAVGPDFGSVFGANLTGIRDSQIKKGGDNW